MKIISILCVSLSLVAVPTAVGTNKQTCVRESELPNGKTQVKIICIGNAEDFGGVSGDTIDCFDETATTSNSIPEEDCKDITVLIKYKMGNAMSDKNDNKIARNRMYFDFADFGQGNFTNKNVGIAGEFTDVSDCNFPSVNKPSYRRDYGPQKFSKHNYNATVNQCAVDGSNQFFMKMRLKPYKIDGDGTKGTKSQKGETYDFLTSKCGTNDKIEFSITPAPTSALTTVIPQAKADPSKGSKATNPSKGCKAPNPSKGSKAPNPSKGSKAPNPSKGSKAPNPSKGSKAPKPSKGPKASSVSNEPSLSPTKSLLPSDVPSVSNEPSDVPSVSNEPSLSPTKSLLPSDVPSVSNEPSLSPSVDCEVKTFAELQSAIKEIGPRDIILCSVEIIFTEQIILTGAPPSAGKTFTCPNGDCILNAKRNSRFFFIEEPGNFLFDGIIFKNGNSGGDNGGAILVRPGGTVEISDCKFNRNSALKGGAIHNNKGSLKVTKSRFKENTAQIDGGAISLVGIEASTFITGSNFRDNEATGNGNNINKKLNLGVVICNVDNIFSGAVGNGGAGGNFPAGICSLAPVP
eukprot:scaffold2800_cov283-Chaetoceros_neogracile.AAC.4